MRIKLDENFDPKLVDLFEAAGHNADTVLSEGLSGRKDEDIYEICRSNQQVLITLDLDFANPFRFPPEDTAGVVVVRPPRPLLAPNDKMGSFREQWDTTMLTESWVAGQTAPELATEFRNVPWLM